MPAFFNVVSMPGTMHLGRHMAWGAENVAHHSVRKGCEQTDFRWMCHGWYIYNMERSLKILVTYFLFFFSLLLSARSHSRHIIVSFLFLRPPFLPSFFSFLPHPCSARLSWPSTASTVAKPAGPDLCRRRCPPNSCRSYTSTPTYVRNTVSLMNFAVLLLLVVWLHLLERLVLWSVSPHASHAFPLSPPFLFLSSP